MIADAKSASAACRSPIPQLLALHWPETSMPPGELFLSWGIVTVWSSDRHPPNGGCGQICARLDSRAEQDSQGGNVDYLLRARPAAYVNSAATKSRLAAAGFATLGRIGRPLLIVDQESRLQFANDAALEQLDESVLHVRAGRVEVVDNAQRERLALAVRRAAGGHVADTVHFALRNRSGSTQLGVSVAPLRPTKAFPFAVPLGMALVVLHDPDRDTASPSLLQEFYGLTEAEVRLVNDLGHGLSMEKHAVQRGVKISTARSHLSAVLSKTGCRRQSDLMRLFASMPRLRD